jgi:hypothetical protein
MNFTNDERLNLKRLIDQSDCDNNTEQIRKLKHSILIRDDIRKMEIFKKNRKFSCFFFCTLGITCM